MVFRKEKKGTVREGAKKRDDADGKMRHGGTKRNGFIESQREKDVIKRQACCTREKREIQQKKK